jgi:hypothetical protein
MKAETSPFKLLLLPLVPLLAFGIVEVASHVSVPATISNEEAPELVVEPDRCTRCAMPA